MKKKTSKNTGKEYSWNIGHQQKIKPSNYKYQRGRRTPGQGHRQDLQQDYGKKLLQTKERHTHTNTRNT